MWVSEALRADQEGPKSHFNPISV